MARKPKAITTVPSVEAVKPVGGRQVEVPDKKVPGLSLRVSIGQDGKPRKRWTLRYRTLDGQQRRLQLGDYPALSLTAARKTANDIRVKVAGGGDPSGERKEARANRRAGKVATVADLLDAYREAAEKGRHRPDGKPKKAATLAFYGYYSDRRLKPKFGAMPIAELKRGQVQRFLDSLAPSTARHCRAVLREAYFWGIRNELASANPAQLVNVLAPGQRERVLTDSELKALWRAFEDLNEVDDATTGRALQLATLTAQRGGEIVGIHARELDREAKLWTLPGSRAKNGRLHLVPLSDPAVGILDAVFGGEDWRGFAFPSRSGSSRPHIGRASLTRSFKRLCNQLGIEGASLHDLRRTAATNMTSERVGVSRFVVSRCLNQLSDAGAPSVTQIYDRSEYLGPKREALTAWADLLTEIISGRQRAGNVVPIGSAR